MAPPSVRNQAVDAQRLYDDRAARYDDSWHPRFAGHVVELADLQPGEHVLDLACGTGLVSYLASHQVGPLGMVTGTDISSGMLAAARAKKSSHPLHNVEFYQHSITDLDSLSELRGKLFDVITCASALVLLANPAEALRQWYSYLKTGGRVIADVTHPQSQLPLITSERVGRTLGKPVPFYRIDFQGPDDLRKIMQAAGLQVVDIKLISQLTIDGREDIDSYLADLDNPRIEHVYDVSDADEQFDRTIDARSMTDLAVADSRPQARKLFREEWARLANASGKIEEVDGVFVGIGRKAQ